MPDQLLNAYQANYVAVTLRLLEIELRDALQQLNAHQQGILYRRTASMSEHQQQALQGHIDDALAQIAHLAQIFNLPVETQNTRSTLIGQFTVLHGDLYDIRAEKLRGYGDVAPHLPDLLNPSVYQLAQCVKHILNVLAE